jgi:hypothetical protein
MKTLSKEEIFKISQKVKNDFFNPRSKLKTSIFLCGANIYDKTKIRYTFSEVFNDNFYSRFYDLVYPEDIFDELLYSRQGKDLLSLENILAKSIDVILIIPESPGSFAELGAFSNVESLRKKIVCIVDQKYKKDKSFINQGPIRLIKKTNKNAIVYVDPDNLTKDLSQIRSAIREVTRKASPKEVTKINLLQLDAFLIPLLYLLEPLSKEKIIDCLKSVIDDEVNIFQIATTALNILTKKKQIELESNGFKLTKLGREDYLDLN